MIDALPARLGEVGHHLGAARLVGPDGRHQQDAFLAQVADRRRADPASTDRPTEILDDDDDRVPRRADRRPVAEQAHLREPVVVAGRQPDLPSPGSAIVGRRPRAQLGHQPSEPPRLGPSRQCTRVEPEQVAERLDERAVRQATGKSGRQPPVRTWPPVATRGQNAPTSAPTPPRRQRSSSGSGGGPRGGGGEPSSPAARPMKAWPRGASTTRR
jgi:hypothetical protein